MKTIDNNKDQKYWAILNSCIQLEISHGHLKWKITDLARKSKISRTLIYYYFGKNKKNIVIEACHYFGSIMAGTTPELIEFYQKNNIAEALYTNRQMLQKIPALIPFYFLNRDEAGEIGKIIRHFEAEGIKKRKLFFKDITDTEAHLLFSLQMGISLSHSDLKLEDIKTGVKMIKLT